MRFVTLIAATVILVAGAVRAEVSDLTGEIWSVCGRDGHSTWDETRLVFTSQTQGTMPIELEGYFDWRSSRGSVGREYFKGTLHDDGALALKGFQLEDSNNIINSRYHAKLSASGTALLEGVWLDGLPGIWAAVHDGGTGSASIYCDPKSASS